MPNVVNQRFNRLLKILREMEALEKKRYDEAIDIDDMAEATTVIIDARTKIQLLRKSIEDIHRIHNCFLDTFADAHEKVSECDESNIAIDMQHDSSDDDIEKDESESKVGVYVRNKLRELSKLDYRFTEEEFVLFQRKDWSKKTLNINYPFVRLYDISKPLQSQLHFQNIKNRYWSELYNFNGRKLLFCSQWYESCRVYFDHWYNKLNVLLREADKPIEEKQTTIDEYINFEETDIHSIDCPHEIILFEKTYTVNGWQEVLVKLCEEMILKKPYVFMGLSIISRSHILEQQILCLDEQKVKEPYVKLSNGLYITVAGSANEINTWCKYIIKSCGFNEVALKIK